MWISRDAALAQLGVKPQSLYASVSRGRIRARPDPTDPRRSLYFAGDVARIASQGEGRRAAAAVAAATIQWGEPVLESAITTVVDGRLFFRGHDVAALAPSSHLEDVAAILWPSDQRPDVSSTTPKSSPFVALAQLADTALPSQGRGRAALLADARQVVGTLVGAVAGPGDADVATRLATAWGASEARDAIRMALVLLADHELNASTFAARVAVSTGASLAAGTLAGLGALSGPRHGSAAGAVLSLARRAEQVGVDSAIRQWLSEGQKLPAMGHPLYPDGDVRAKILLTAGVTTALSSGLYAGLEAATGEVPNIDFALAALALRFDLQDSAPLQLFAVGRVIGWVAHMLEQLDTGTLIRPRARYVGPPPFAG